MMKAGSNEKIMKVMRDKNSIKITFLNNQNEEQKKNDKSFEKYKVFIKNILFDGRSRLDYEPYKQLNIKKRLLNLIYDMKVAIAPKEILEKEISNALFMDERAIFRIIPELKDCENFDHKHPHHCYDIWNHTKVAMQKSEPNLQIRLALLLHDIGKPHSYQEDGEVRHFHGHPQKSAEMSQEILTRLGYSEKEVEEICYLVENHDNIINVDNVNKDNIELTKKLLYIQYCDAYAHDPKHIEKRIRKLDEIKEKLKEKINELQKNEEIR